MPPICMAPSPTMATDTRSGKPNLAAIPYGTPGTMVARLPDRDAFMPRRIRMWRAYQSAAVPESDDKMAWSGR